MQAYTDGGFKNNKASWAYVILKDGKILAQEFGLCESTTRNIGAEIAAVINCINKYESMGLSEELTIFHDYIGLGLWANGSWKTNITETQSYALFTMSRSYLVFQHVKGHNKDKWNTYVDTLCSKALK